MPAQLVALNDGPTILLDKPILLIGRHPECDIQIDSRKISRRHCIIAQVNDYLVVRDLDSTNGIRINGVRVLDGKLNPGDELTIGNNRYRVTWDESAPAPHLARQAEHAPASAPPIEDDDDALENADEPIPLADPGRTPQPHPKGRSPGSQPVSGAASTDDEDGFILPDNLRLLPGSSLSGPSTPKPPG
jgi:predicted component of type VI protein secretion system